MKAIFKKELRSYFHNMIGPVFMAAVMLFTGLYFCVNNIYYGYPFFGVSLSGVSVVLLLLVPVLTMRSFAEEKKSKTDQLLLTSPLSVTQIVMGKFLAMAGVLGICMIICCLGPVVLHFYGAGSFLADYAAILAFFLMGCAYMSIGMFISSLTESQVLAAVGTFIILLILQLSDGLAGLVSSSSLLSFIGMIVIILIVALLIYYMTKNIYVAEGTGLVLAAAAAITYHIKKTLFEGLISTILSSISLASRFDTVLNQTLNVSDFIFYISVSGLFVFLTVQAVQKRRWS